MKVFEPLPPEIEHPAKAVVDAAYRNFQPLLLRFVINELTIDLPDLSLV
jgi:hypothetical protein